MVADFMATTVVFNLDICFLRQVQLHKGLRLYHP